MGFRVKLKKSESQMGFEPTTLRDQVGCSTTYPLETLVVSKGQNVGIDWNRIARLNSYVLPVMNSLTASRCHIKASHMNSLI